MKDAVGVSRRGALALLAAAGTAGCVGSGTATDSAEDPSVSVSLGFWSAQKLSTDDYEPIPEEFVHQVAVDVHDPSPAVQKVEFVVFSEPSPLVASWKLPDQVDESRQLGENIYGKTVHDGEATFEPGDPYEARAYTADGQWRVRQGEVPENDHESE